MEMHPKGFQLLVLMLIIFIHSILHNFLILRESL